VTEYVLEVGFGPHSTYLFVTQGKDCLWDDALPEILDSDTIRLLLEHAGWQLLGEQTADELGWWQTCVPVA
jgi:hypothetical protein